MPCFNAGPVLQTDAHHWTNLECLLWTLVNFEVLHSTIKITVVIQSNTKLQPNVVLMLGGRLRQWYNIHSTERQVNVFTGPSECVFISQTNNIQMSIFKVTAYVDMSILKFNLCEVKQEWIHYATLFATNTLRPTTWKTPPLIVVLKWGHGGGVNLQQWLSAQRWAGGINIWPKHIHGPMLYSYPIILCVQIVSLGFHWGPLTSKVCTITNEKFMMTVDP